ncbi:hypothetical protein C5B42_03455 [Candidatus Cerribacteria bacterium 'Amazon FNV 2010 28 9']|uniref:Uncharacterized protein n=1 Tax=Candidatus Cerribacteria bacterium 'Amazon FNV 2010 28 9' TaxID=2081795 RepID=A0A317JNF9_9BACT|nr:MAG: hypothetical protein C5B42_03455 [Candidatus Cerribacteria bacterium 'Amazon FNV 2010 28 9']
MQLLLTIMIATLVILSAVIVVFLLLLIMVLLMMRRTLLKVQKAVDEVEKTALRSLIPLLSFKRMFTDMGGFMESVKAWAKVVEKKPHSSAKKADSRGKEKEE